MNLLLTIAYDGTAYCGWQRQNNAITVQQRVEEALTDIFGRTIAITGAGRTDTGVHALHQKATFQTEACPIPLDRLPLVLNGKLPPDIVVTQCEKVSDDFHPRFSAKEKTYRYQILNTRYPNPLLRNRVWHIPRLLDIHEMEIAAACFIGTHDFSAVCAAGAMTKTFTRTVYHTALEKQEDFISFYIRGNGFLYNMVRIITGTLVYAGLNKISAESIPDILLSRDRTRAGITAPPQGLTLYEIFY